MKLDFCKACIINIYVYFHQNGYFIPIISLFVYSLRRITETLWIDRIFMKYFRCVGLGLHGQNIWKQDSVSR